MYTINFDFVGKALYFLFSNHLHLGPFCSFWSLLFYFWVGVRFKNFYRAYSHRLSTLVLEVKCYLFVITSAPFGAFFAFLGPHWTIYEVWIRLKKIAGASHIDYYLWFWSKALDFFIPPHLGLFCTFWILLVDLWSWSMFKTFLGPPYIKPTLLFWRYCSILLLWNFPGEEDGDG